jgi:hypothetical protein
MRRLRGFGRFWWGFVVGDNWRLALGAVVALTTPAVFAHSGFPAWWTTPAVVTTALVVSVAGARPQHPRREEDVPVHPTPPST